ncbi:MAG: Gfo/Idh/MocA family oxidoreductase [Candidatus Omnitrophica bacterium]|nr:Gfo/Idh/MocA family oxidoreductase [Candidatus Omnitrophota bacterium]
MKIKVSVIGCGGIASAHIARLAILKDDVEFTAFCDVVKEKAEAKANQYGGKVYTDFREMFDKEKFDACFICVPPFAHQGQEELCIEKNIPFFVEKPIHLDLKKARGIAKKVEEKKLLTSVGYVLRNFEIIEKAREIIKNEKIAIVRGKYYGQVPGGEGSWLIKKEFSGGQLIEQATHTVDMMRYFAGDVAEVFAYKFEGINNKIYKGYDVEDASIVVMKFKNGVIGNLTCTWLWNGYHSGVEVVGKGIIINYEGNTLTIDRGNKKEIFVDSIDPMLEEDKRFIEAIKKSKPELIKSSYADALKTLEVTLKSHISMLEGKPVEI